MSFIILLIIGGFGAGVVTGLAGASAATIVTPVMSMLAGLPTYTAITIALFTDVFASSVSAYTFWKNGNINIKKGMFVAIFVVSGSIFGSYLSTKVSSDSLGVISLLSILLVSINFLKKSNRMQKEELGEIEKQEDKLYFQEHKTLAIIVFGLLIGFLCGFVGAGGGLMILLMLSSILGLDTKTGVGTSVLVMTFTALSGGLAHIPNVEPITTGLTLLPMIIISGLFGIVGAKIAANYANKVKEYVLLRIVALTFLTLIVVSVITKFL